METLNAAISHKHAAKLLSHEQFQKDLNSLFQERGVLTDLRLYLRFKLVSLLKDTAVGKDINERHTQCTSLRDQALNLVVAEYLLQNRYHYTLSVFNTEATFASLILSGEKMKDDGYDSCFGRENILHILELIGLNRSGYCDKLLDLYFNTQRNKSVLYCLITVISEMWKASESELPDTRTVDIDADISFQREAVKLLRYTNLPEALVSKISENINVFHETIMERQRSELLLLINQMNSEIKYKEEQIRDLHRSKSILQNKLVKANKDFKATKSRFASLLRKDKVPDPVISTNKENQLKLVENEPCRLLHCNQVCKNNSKLTEDLTKENMNLKKENAQQKQLLQKLFRIYKDLLSEFNDCQNKLNFLNGKVSSDRSAELFNKFLYGENSAQGMLQKSDDEEASSDTLTDEILHQTRMRLQKLEEETQEIEGKFKNNHV